MSGHRAIQFHPKVNKDLDKLENKQYRQVVDKILDLQRDCRPNDSRHMRGEPDVFRVDFGQYRVTYMCNEVVYVRTVGPKNDGKIYDIDGRRSGR